VFSLRAKGAYSTASLGQTPQEIRFLHEQALKARLNLALRLLLNEKNLDSHFQCLSLWNPQTLGRCLRLALNERLWRKKYGSRK